MTKRERLAEALITRNKSCDLAQEVYEVEVGKLNLPHFKIDWSEAMTTESHLQELLIAPIREMYHAARHKAFGLYKAVR